MQNNWETYWQCMRCKALFKTEYMQPPKKCVNCGAERDDTEPVFYKVPVQDGKIIVIKDKK